MTQPFQYQQKVNPPTQNFLLNFFQSHTVNPEQQNPSLIKKTSKDEENQVQKIHENQNFKNQKICQKQEQCCEFRRQKTFFCHPVQQINFDCYCQNKFEEISQSNTEIELQTVRKPYYSAFSRSQFYSAQTFIQHAETPRGRQISIVKQMDETQQNTLLNSTENDNEKVSESQQMIEELGKSQMQSQRKISFNLLESMKSMKSQKQINKNQALNQIQQGNQNHKQLIFQPRKSILRQIQEKIKKQKTQQSKKRARFSLKQFYSNKNLLRQGSPTKKAETQELVEMILEKVQLQNVPKKSKENIETSKLIEMMTLAIVPQFQKLQNEYKGEMFKIQQKIEELTRRNSENNLRESVMRKSSHRKSPMSNQSVIRINLNDDFDMKQSCNDGLRDSAILAQIQERNDEFDRVDDEICVPNITRTDSQDQFFIPCLSQKSL